MGFLPPQCTNQIHFPIEQDSEIEHRSSFTAPRGGDRHKCLKLKKKITNTHDC